MIYLPRYLMICFKLAKQAMTYDISKKFADSKKNSVKMCLETISYRAAQLWNLVPTEIKDTLSLSIFKEKIKLWYCDDCPCTLCKTYIANVGFV